MGVHGDLKVGKFALNIVFTCIFLELFIGGSGRLIEFTSFLTLRMCLFVVYMFIVAAYLYIKPVNVYVAVIIIYFLISCCLSAVVGFINGASVSDIFADIKPLLNTFLLLYLYYSIDSPEKIKHLIKLIKISSVILVVLHLVLYIVFLQNKDILLLYSALTPAGDDAEKTMFFFKGDNGFVNYTGDVYLCIGFIVWEQYHKNGFLKYVMLLLLLVSMVLTGTRGLMLGLAMAYFVKFLFLRLNYRSLAYVVVGGALAMMVYLQIKDNIGDKQDSDQTRFNTISQVVDRINPLSVIVGHGFGIGVPERPVHMEISYLEVFHKQGVIGLLYYLLILFVSYFYYKKCNDKEVVGFYMFVLFVYFLTFTNPYINHPLGITIIYIGIVSMIKFSEFSEEQKVELID